MPGGFEDSLSSASFSPDGMCIITTSHNDDIARFWDAATGQALAQLRSQPPPGESSRLPEDCPGLSGASFSPDGTKS